MESRATAALFSCPAGSSHLHKSCEKTTKTEFCMVNYKQLFCAIDL